MGRIEAIAKIAADREKAREITEKVQRKGEQGDNRRFIDILQEEIDKVNKEGDKN
ncbi:hypothetical protein [Clostridium saccharoperbutylacetonicum]|uniref:hypothetical protein n=1 Tax=Clostridium saccharoperbutylacetonicum TaxID=36745 RepID=UPI000983F25A|nr:hypothetical protein [Clostridium saccharoperbutylacetonicum]AQR95523.1 hypothetical protein CLSAP_28390 [Clostridium saccharoperbutylacetonicum]NSB31383.1 flagellar hook-basal body complex protein FliE [Clostridium saccharoperbutylacetonicum]